MDLDMDIADDLLKRRSGGGLMQFSETYKPFHYPWAVEITTRHEKAHWIEDELDLSEDVADWKSSKVDDIEKSYSLNSENKLLIKTLLLNDFQAKAMTFILVLIV